ncbi:hypothetical protein ASG01_02915 [Chryseobacterium sp. Leaf180]|uniref:hypothetical protein n=1 Tax=Chryseobacterium sp. Leaf180 TaxID=1736289 RepID=UPI0006F7A93D|nr:hypothetical protein [Chryseobacterium sp. Leaf180]KQR94832.1 hypothetical protein ASG01_02915 [Chryseobacterium sp. Leaf180]
MKNFKNLALLALFTGITLSHAQQTIPFRITKHNNLIIKSLVNDRDSLDLMFQIAMEDASISPERTRKADHITFKDEISIGNTVKIGTEKYENIRFFDNEITGHEADGKIGIGIFKGKTFKIDYDNSQFVIYDKMPDLKGYQSMPLFAQNGALYIVADNIIEDQQDEVYFLLQSGYSGGLIYCNEFSDGKNLDKKLKITGEKTMKNSAGRSVTTKQGILPFLKVGDFVLKNVSAGFFVGELKTQTVNYLGADLLRRFNWIFDKGRNTVYIKPSKYFESEYYQIK